MKTLYLRVWLTVVAVLALFALGSGWLFHYQIERERVRSDSIVSERMAAWAEMIQRSLPAADASLEEQAQALREWAVRLRVPLALEDTQGRRIGASASFERRMVEDAQQRLISRVLSIDLEDGRMLLLMRPPPRPPEGRRVPPEPPAALFWLGPGWTGGAGLLVVLALLFLAVAGGAFPVVRRLTRRLEALKHGVEQFGAGALNRRVDGSGRDEVAAVARSFNQAAQRIEALVHSHQSLLANASHELRSPLARLKMAVAMLDDAPAPRREQLKQEIHTNIGELDALVEEVLLAGRLDAQAPIDQLDRVELGALALEQGARVGAAVQDDGGGVEVNGDERLLRRAVRNLLENAARYGGGAVTLTVTATASEAELRVCDRGRGVPEAMRERIFEPFFRLPGHAEREGGVGLGLSLVKQIAERHAGCVRCEAREGGGSCFVLTLPKAQEPGPAAYSASPGVHRG
jgi:signal transduction histidine kinase